MACSEVAPLVKVGGLADAVAALAKTLSRLEHRVTIALPKYQALEAAGLMMARRLTPLRFDVGAERVDATLFDARLTAGVELLLIDVPGAFDRPAIYGEADDAKRFGRFCRAVVQLVKAKADAGTPYDAVHAHDWPTGLLPFLLAKLAERPRTVFTVHNAFHQGRFPESALDEIGLDPADFTPAALEYYGDLHLLKAGVLSADAVTTVSPTYARELLSPDSGVGLDGVFRSRGDDLVGILNGIDYAYWSPATDPSLPARYDAENASNKGRCKAALLHELDLHVEPERPLLVSLGRIDEQKGSDILAASLGEIVRTGARVVIAGSGDPRLMSLLEDAAQSSNDEALFLGAVSEPMSHRLIGAADAVLMPSRYEPCGLVQQYAQRYGAPPIARATGGLCDTIVDCDAQLATGTGFLFDEATPEAFVAAVQRAVSAMQLPSWGTLRRRVMRLDHSWERPARRYARLYAAS